MLSSLPTFLWLLRLPSGLTSATQSSVSSLLMHQSFQMLILMCRYPQHCNVLSLAAMQSIIGSLHLSCYGLQMQCAAELSF